MGLFDRVNDLLWGAPNQRALTYQGIPLQDPVLAEWFGGAISLAGQRVTSETALKVPAFAACVRLLTDTLATVPLDFYERRSADERVKVNQDPRFAVLQQPNAWQTGVDFRRWLAQQTLTWGNGAARIVFDGAGIARQLLPMPWSRVIGPYMSGGSYWYRYTPFSGGAITLSAAEVLHVRGPWPTQDGLKSQNPIDLFRETIGLALAQNEYLARFFSNGAVPKGAIEIPGAIGDKAAEALRASWERRHQGLENAHRLAILDGGMKFHELGISNKDAEALESYKMTIGEICRIFGIPPHMVGQLDNSTSWGTGIEQQALGFIMFVVRPWFVGTEAALNNSLLSASTRQNHYFEHNADGLLRGDFKSRMEGYAIQIQWGLATANECRRKENMPPIEGGDERLQPLNMAPASIVKDVLLKNPVQAARAMRMLLTGEFEKEVSDAA